MALYTDAMLDTKTSKKLYQLVKQE